MYIDFVNLATKVRKKYYCTTAVQYGVHIQHARAVLNYFTTAVVLVDLVLIYSSTTAAAAKCIKIYCVLYQYPDTIYIQH